MATGDVTRLRDFVRGFGALTGTVLDEADILREGAALLRALVAADDWLPAAFATPDPQRYRQYLLHCDSAERFSIVSFVWGPGQSTPIHDHTVWGLVGVLRGAELVQNYRRPPAGPLVAEGPAHMVAAGDVETISPAAGDIHRVHNAYDNRTSISIHVYGANIGAVRRSVFDESGHRKAFISGYANETLPNIWDCS